MITDIEKFIEIQYILAEWDVNIDDCKKINDLIIELSNENKQLKDNWNKLREWIHFKGDLNITEQPINYITSDILDKIQELEQGDDNNE